jgi:transposase
MDYWAKPVLDREQTLLFYPTLDSTISDDHPVRQLEEILRGLDWSAWEAEYDGTRGQPPIPPWVLAGVILYGMMRRVRSSRMLEYLCTHSFDYIWLVEGRHIDYSTICNFRKRFGKPLKDLFRQVVQIGMRMGLVTLLEVAFDGTRVKANASRCATWTAKRLEAALKELESLFDQAMAETDQADAAAQDAGAKKHSLPPDLATAKARQAKLKELLAEIQAADEARRKAGTNPEKNPAQIPKADTDSVLMPNKEGGHAPNYTPLAATDAKDGWIVDADVVADPHEEGETLAAVDHIEENFGEKPERFMADSQHATGANLEGMEQRQVDFYTPMESPSPTEGNPAKREDPRQAVPEAEWGKLPRNAQKKLDKSDFVYDAEKDLYYCPMGRELRYEETKKQERGGATVEMRVYRCPNCEGCGLASECRAPKAVRGRSIRRDPYEPVRERMHQKVKSPEGKAIYARRMHTAETPFGYIKAVMGLRQFLLRGLENVRTEWLWTCTAYNLKKLLTAVARLRAEVAKMRTETTS